MFKAQSRAGFFSPRVAGDQIGRTAAAAAVSVCVQPFARFGRSVQTAELVVWRDGHRDR